MSQEREGVGEKFYVTVIEAEERGIKNDEEQIPHPPNLQLVQLAGEEERHSGGLYRSSNQLCSIFKIISRIYTLNNRNFHL